MTTPSPQAALAQRLRSAVTEGVAAELDAVLHPQACFMALGKTLQGAAAVRAELLAPDTRAAWQALLWSPAQEVDAAAQVVDAAVRLVGTRAPGRRDRGLVLTLAFEAGRISSVQLQRVPPPPPAATPLLLWPQIRQAIDQALVDKHPMLLAYADADGQPVLSYRGSVQVFSDDQLALWVRNREGAFIQAINHNPRVALMYRNEGTRATYQFQGRARVSADVQTRQQVFDRAAEVERAHDFAMLGAAVLIDLDRVEGYAGVGPQGQIDQVHMQRAQRPQRPQRPD